MVLMLDALDVPLSNKLSFLFYKLCGWCQNAVEEPTLIKLNVHLATKKGLKSKKGESLLSRRDFSFW